MEMRTINRQYEYLYTHVYLCVLLTIPVILTDFVLHGCTMKVIIWEHIWEKGPIGNIFTNSNPEKVPF